MVLQDLREPTPCLWRRRLFTAVQGRDRFERGQAGWQPDCL